MTSETRLLDYQPLSPALYYVKAVWHPEGSTPSIRDEWYLHAYDM